MHLNCLSARVKEFVESTVDEGTQVVAGLSDEASEAVFNRTLDHVDEVTLVMENFISKLERLAGNAGKIGGFLVSLEIGDVRGNQHGSRFTYKLKILKLRFWHYLTLSGTISQSYAQLATISHYQALLCRCTPTI